MKTFRNKFNYRIQVILIAIVFGLFLQTEANAQRSRSRELLKKIAFASDSLSYQAVTTYEYISKDGIRRYKQESIITPGKKWWRSIEPESRNVRIQKGNLTYTLNLENDSVSVRINRPRSEFIDEDNIRLLHRNYKISFLREDLEQNQLVEVVKIAPRQQDRSWIQIWVDSNTGFIYKLERYDKDNYKFYQEFKNDVVFDPQIEAGLFEVSYTGNVPSLKFYESLTDLQQDIDFQIKSPEFTPSSFIQNGIIVRQRESRSRENTAEIQFYPEVQLMYTDGLASFSLFQSERRGRKDTEISVREYLRYGKKMVAISAIKNETWLFMVGDLPRETMIKMFEEIDLFAKNEKEAKRGLCRSEELYKD